MDPLSHYYLSSVELKFAQSGCVLGVTVDNEFGFHQYLRDIMGRVLGLAHNFLRTTVCCSSNFLVLFFATRSLDLSWTIDGVCGTLVSLVTRWLEAFQRQWTKNANGLSDYASRLRHIVLFSMKGRLLRSDLRYWNVIQQQNGENDFGGYFPACS